VLGNLTSSDGYVDLVTGGLAVNKAKVLDVAEWTFHLPLSLVGGNALNKYRRGIELAECAGQRLREAIGSYFEDLAVGEFRRKDGRFSRNDPRSRAQRNKVIAKAAAFYWRMLDSSYAVLVVAASDPTRGLAGDWYGLVRDAMKQAYERACPCRSSRQLRAYVKGSQRLVLGKPGQPDANLAA